MTAVPFGATLLPDGRLSAFACGAGVRHTTARCPRDVGPYTFVRAVLLLLENDAPHHALVEPGEVTAYADHVDRIQTKRERVQGSAAPRVKRIDGRAVTVPESDEAFYARVDREVCGVAEERDKARGRVERVREPVRVAVPVNLRVDEKGVVER